LVLSLKIIEEVADYINGYRRSEALKIYEIEQKIVGFPGSITDPPTRLFVREGSLAKISSRATQHRYFFLFHDMLVYTQLPKGNSFQYKGTISLFESGIWVRSLKDTPKFKNLFQIVTEKKAYTLFAESPEEKTAWIADISAMIMDFFEKFPHLRGALYRPKVRRALGTGVRVDKFAVESGGPLGEFEEETLDISQPIQIYPKIIRISDPETLTQDGEKFTTYLVLTSAQFKGFEFSVRRRYNDFVWLKAQLKKRFREKNNIQVVKSEMLGICRLPGDTLSSALTNSGRFEPSFIEARRVALENFLNSVAHNKHFKSDNLFLKFLRDPDMQSVVGGHFKP
jgi:hypothetical protein